jgi:hypothetical protein
MSTQAAFRDPFKRKLSDTLSDSNSGIYKTSRIMKNFHINSFTNNFKYLRNYDMKKVDTKTYAVSRIIPVVI